MHEVDPSVIDWLLEGDVVIQYQAYRDLLDSDREDLRRRIAHEGWGQKFLTQRRPDGHWGRGYYQPKWTSTHYTLIDLKNLGISPDQEEIRETVKLVLEKHKADDGGIYPSSATRMSDLCIDGMFLNVASYFRADEELLGSVIDLLIDTQMDDGGFNCRVTRSGAVHSSMHTTISVLEGFQEYKLNGYAYRIAEVKQIAAEAREFLLQHHLFKSDRTGAVIDKRYLMLSYPSRWRYDILRALDYFRSEGLGYDARMQSAIDVLLEKRKKNGTWPVQARHPGQAHFEMEKTGQSSRWNTLRAMRVLRHFKSLSLS
jgi:hypothetical protein